MELILHKVCGHPAQQAVTLRRCTPDEAPGREIRVLKVRVAGEQGVEHGLTLVREQAHARKARLRLAQLRHRDHLHRAGDLLRAVHAADARADLMQADLGIAVGGGTDVAIESAQVVLVNGDIRNISTTLRLSKATIRNVKENLFWAFGYNIIGIPVAAGVLHIFGGPLLDPMIAAAAMSLSSVSVVSNALRLKRFK